MQGAKFAPLERNSSPEQITIAFIRDFKTWNDYSHSLHTTGGADAVSKAAKAYDRIIAKYCDESYTGQPIAFGSESRHDPKNETILRVEVAGDRATVHTKQQRIYGTLISPTSTDTASRREMVDGTWWVSRL